MIRLYVLFLLCSASVATAQFSSHQQQQIKIGMLLTLSGPFASAGEDCRLGVNAALAIANSQSRFEIVFGDSKNDPTSAISEFRKMTDVDKVWAIYTHRGNVGMALNPASEKSSMPLLAAVGNKNFAKNNKFAIQIWPKSSEEGEFFANEFVEQGYKNVALIYTQDDWTTAVSDSFRDKYKALGGKILIDQSLVPTESDFKSLLLQVKSKQPEVVFFDALLPQIGPLVKQARELGVKSVIYSNFYAAKKEVLESAGASSLEGVRFVDIDTSLPTLGAKLSPIGDVTPSGLTVSSYLATLLLIQTINSDPGIQSKEDLYTALLQQKEIRTPDRIFSIKDRAVEIPLAIKKYHQGSVVLFDK